MCCGQKRTALNANGRADLDMVKMLYRGRGSAQIRGQITGQIYQFPRQQPVQAVHPRDVPALIRTRLFSQVH
jgi:hypothetical protein